MDDSKEAQILKRLNEFYRALNEKDIEKFSDFVSNDIIAINPNVPPFLGKKAVIDYVKNTFQRYDRDYKVVSHRIKTSKTGDQAICWLIRDSYLDDIHVERSLLLFGIGFEDGAWRYHSFIETSVDVNWTW